MKVPRRARKVNNRSGYSQLMKSQLEKPLSFYVPFDTFESICELFDLGYSHFILGFPFPFMLHTSIKKEANYSTVLRPNEIVSAPI